MDVPWFKKFRQALRTCENTIERFPRSAQEAEGLALAILDDFEHFCQDAYHVKDHVANDPDLHKNRPDAGKRMEHAINRSWRLRLLADLCNGTKHFGLKRSRTGSEVEMSIQILEHHDGRVERQLWLVLGDGSRVDAFQFMWDVLEELIEAIVDATGEVDLRNWWARYFK
jgi:hypothetical protein